jgi:RNA polymerase sigma factor for flagellar operon FliA
VTGYSKYIEQISLEEQEEITREFIPKIKSWVIRMSRNLPNSVDLDDLYSAACLGLVESFKRFDKQRNVDFKSFAEKRVKGAMLDFLRQLDILPRNLRTKLKNLEEEINKLTSRLGKKPTVEEIAKHTNYSEDEIYDMLNILENNQSCSLNVAVGEDNDTDLIDFIKGNLLNPEETLEKEELVKVIAESIDNLNEKEKKVITLYYYEELTMKEIGEVLNISESRISQIHSSAVKTLKKRLKGYFYGN